MKKFFLFLGMVLFLNGCFAIVDEGSGSKEVRSSIITKEETLDILRQANDKKPEEINEVFRFKAPETN